MKELSKILTNSKTTEASTVAERITSAYRQSNISDDTFLTGFFNNLNPLLANLIKAIKKMKAESELEEKDEKRDNVLRGIYHLVQGYMYHPDVKVKTSAVKVNEVFENYGLEIVSESYATESSLIESLMKDLEKSELKEHIEALSGLGQLINNLREAQSEFEKAKLKYDDEKVEENKLDSATKLKMEVISLINEKLIVYLLAMVQVDNEKYGTFAQTAGKIINDNNTAVKKRRKKP